MKLINFDKSVDMERVNKQIEKIIKNDLAYSTKKFRISVDISDSLPEIKQVEKIGDLMKELANKKSRIVRDVARAIPRLYGVPPKDHVNELWALQHWIQRNIRYVLDRDEQFQFPERVLLDWFEKHDGADCDCMSILFAAMAKSLGYKRVAVGLLDTKRNGKINHAIALVKLPKCNSPWGCKWIGIELTKKKPFGWIVKHTKLHIKEV